LIRGGARRVREWFEEERVEKTECTEKKPRYQWLNDQYLKVVQQVDQKPYYVWGVIQGAGLAQVLGLRQISVIEFGVAGGNGLVTLQDIAVRVEELLGVKIDVYGFDTGTGLPKPTDYRDMPHFFAEGFYPMDAEKLNRRLHKGNLRLGQIKTTISDFINSKPAPVAFISFDLDLYSSTKDAFALLEANQNLLLPRIHCYFDDILGFSYSDFTGELLAIAEFNAAHEMKKISKIQGLQYFLPPGSPKMWAEQFYLAHMFDHDCYSCYDGLNPAQTLELLAGEIVHSNQQKL
jgi:hypothetical protein